MILPYLLATGQLESTNMTLDELLNELQARLLEREAGAAAIRNVIEQIQQRLTELLAKL